MNPLGTAQPDGGPGAAFPAAPAVGQAACPAPAPSVDAGDRIGEYGAFFQDPAMATGALPDAFGTAVAPGQAVIRSSTAQQRVDTEEIAGAAGALGAASLGFVGTEAALVPLLVELETVWSVLSGEAGQAADLWGLAQHRLMEVIQETADYAAKLRLAQATYEHAEEVAAQVLQGFDQLHGQGFRLAYASAFAAPGPLFVVGLAAGLVPEAALFVVDSRLRGTSAATASALKGSGVQVPRTLGLMATLKQAERSAGIGLVAPQDFHEVDNGTSGSVRKGAAGFQDLSEKLRDAGHHDQEADAVQGPQDQVSSAHVDVTVVTRPDGTRAYLVSIPGSDFENLWSTSEPNGTLSTLDAATTRPETPLSASPVLMQMVDRALQSAGAGPDQQVLLSGFSQGGMAAMALAGNREFTGKYRVSGVMTQGAPERAYGGVDARIPIAQLVDADDPVVRATGDGARPANDQTLRIHTRVASQEGGKIVKMTHGAEEYLRAAQAADVQARGDREGRAYLRMLEETMPEGSTLQTRTYEAGTEHPAGPSSGPASAEKTADSREREGERRR